MIEGGADVEATAASEGLGRACTGFVVDDDSASDGAKGSGVEVEGAIVVFPDKHSRVEGGLTKEIEGDFGLL